MTPNEARNAILFLREIKAEVAKEIVGQAEIIDGLLAAVATGGHVLLESNPGLGKTTLAKEFARSLKLGRRFGRIQFTPDLLPSDITGTQLPERENGVQVLRFKQGPIFHSILLADEINRATPKTQAAMLEAMAERQVTVLGKSYSLTEPVTGFLDGREVTVETPFMVIATQNPIDQDGTYDLPEAQADRFQLKLLMEPPNTEQLQKIVEREALGAKPAPRAAAPGPDKRMDDAMALPGLVRLQQLRNLAATAPVLPETLLHAAYIVQATNGPKSLAELTQLPTRSRTQLADFVTRYVDIPLGPRTAIALVSVAKVNALLRTDPANADQWQDNLAAAVEEMGLGVLRHRLKLKYDWESYARTDFGADALVGREELRDRVVARLIALTAPQGGAYHTYFAKRS